MVDLMSEFVRCCGLPALRRYWYPLHCRHCRAASGASDAGILPAASPQQTAPEESTQPQEQPEAEAQPEPQLLEGLPQGVFGTLLEQLSDGAKAALILTCKRTRDMVLQHAPYLKATFRSNTPAAAWEGLCQMLRTRAEALDLHLDLQHADDSAVEALIE